MKTRKALTTLIKALVVIFALLLLLYTSTQLFGETEDRSSGFLDSIFGSANENAVRSAIKSRCSKACFNACQSGGSPDKLTVEHPDKDKEVQCMGKDQHRSMKGWECEC